MQKKTRDKFVSMAEAQAKLYNGLKEIMDEEYRALQAKDVNMLDAAVKKEEAVIKEIQSIEDEKNVLFSKMADEAGFKQAKGLTMSDILERVGSEDSEIIQAAVSKLISAVNEISVINSKNTHILKNYINYVDFSEKTVNREKAAAENAGFYTQSGKKKNYEMPQSKGIDKTI